MRNVNIPRLYFGRWVAWQDRNSIDGAEYPGVYLLATSQRNLEGKKADVGQAAYIGMTNNKKGLKVRWSQFNHGIQGGGRHSGGDLMFRTLGHYETWDKRLYVAACPVECDPVNPSPSDYLLMGAVAYLEYKAFAIFLKKRPKLRKPRFNTR